MQKHCLLYVLLLSGLLTACGGSGSDSTPPPPPPPPADFDKDGIADSVDTDDDNDGVADTDDAFPFDASEWLDTDSDGVGNNADEDDDNDGVPDAEDAFPLDASESVDTDGDGIGNNADEDDDNDGVSDADDAFPLDPTEQMDTDGDGIGNNADEDDDNDGVPDSEDAFPLDPDEWADTDNDGVGDNADFYPNDAGCHKESDGNGEQCYLTYFKENKNNIQSYVFNETVTFFDNTVNQIIQLDSETLSFNAPIRLSVTADITSLAYSSSDQMFYAGSAEGATFAIDLGGNSETLYESGYTVNHVSVVGAFIGILDENYELVVVDKNGALLSRQYVFSPTMAIEWDSGSHSAFLYETHEDRSPFVVQMSIDQQNGLTEFGSEVYLTAEPGVSRELVLLPDSSDYLFYAGNVLSKSTLTEMSGDAIAPQFDSWFEGLGLVTLDYAAGNTLLTWYSENFDEYAQTTIRGVPVALGLTDARAVVVTERLSSLQISTFDFSDDIDGDSVSNDEDAYPSDPAASLDSDGDGYPDAWNEGKSGDDSTTGLSLDAFPSEYDCFLEVHTTSQGACNYSATVPVYTPTNIMAGPEDTVFIYIAETARVYVYDAESETFSASLDFADRSRAFGFSRAPQQVIYHASFERFYLHYNTDTLYAKNYAGGAVSELIEVKGFEAQSINSVTSVGQYVLVSMRGYSHVRYILDRNGVETDSDTSRYFSNTVAWNGDTNRLYHFRDGISPNDIMYTEINQSSGRFGNTIESPYHGDFAIYGSINIINDGQDVVIGSGDIYDASELTWKGSYGALETISSLGSNDVLVLRKAGNTTHAIRNDGANRVLETRQIASSDVEVVQTDNELVFVYSTDDALVVERYQANDDTDGDGVTNVDDAFPSDVAASADSDNDGYPDAWNAGYTESDSTTGLFLDAFPSDSACWLDSHADTNGNCDYAATMPNFIPDETLVGMDGTVHLVSFANATVYRWSPASNSFINPIHVGRNNGFAQTVPTKAAISHAHGRLYFAYETGEITYIDLDGTSSEQPFFQLPQQVGGIQAVGAFVLAQDNSGAWATHYIIDENGVLTDSEDWNYYSTHYAWNALKQRVYFFRSDTSPNNIHYEVINQTSGLITGSGESPYHGDYSIQGPILISANGERVILGSGDIYDAEDLRWLGNVGQFSQGITLPNGEIGLLRQQNNGFTYVRLDQNGRVLEEYTVEASFAALATDGVNPALVTLEDGEFTVVPVVANNDTDGDGIVNTEDAFPLDPAASVDTDGDGYPDSWNSGYDQEDSTTGLTLDTFPADSACWENDHATDTGACDYAATMPSFTPSHTVIDESGVVYLLNPGDSKIYRWNNDENSYLNPLKAGNGANITPPLRMVYSASHRRLYFGYEDGSITYIAIDDSIGEESFFRLPSSVGGLAATGEYVLAQDASGAWNTHYILDESGALTDSEDWNYYSTYYAWNDANSRVYFFRSGSSPNDLHYETIDQNTGIISASGESPYHSDQNIYGPIRIINNGSSVLLGSGAIYDANDLTLSSNIGINVADAAGFNDIFIAISQNDGANQTLKIYKNDDLSLQHSEALEQNVLSAFRWNEQFVMVGQQNGEFTFTLFNTGDSDNDGMPAWWEISYGLSDEDAMDAFDDNDADGLTNSEEFTLGSDPTNDDTDGDGLIDGAEVNTYSTNVMQADTDSDGLSDGEEVNTHGTSPLASDTDNDLFSDGDEVLLYGTDPLDPDSVPEAMTSFSESFEGNELSNLFATTDTSDANWDVSTFEPQDGEQVARSGNIDDDQSSSLTFSGLFADGTLSFDAKVSSESCCDRLQVFVNDAEVLTVGDGDWSRYTVTIPQGETTIEWRYYKDGSVSSGEDAAFLDNILFSQ